MTVLIVLTCSQPIYSTYLFSKNKKNWYNILVAPTDGIELTGLENEYEVGKMVEAECTVPGARPPPNITWSINGIQVYYFLQYGYFATQSYLITLIRLASEVTYLPNIQNIREK